MNVFENCKNILLIIPNLGHGGAQKSICQLSIELSEFHKVHLMVFDYEQSELVYPYEAKLVGLNLGKANGIFSKWISIRKRVKFIKQYKRVNSIDYSISFLEGANYVNVLSKLKEKVIVSIRGSKRFDQNIKGAEGLVRKHVIIPRILKKADRIIAIGNGIKNELLADYNLPKTKITVIPPSFNSKEIDEKLDSSLASEHQKIFAKPTIIYHGRLAYEKGQDKLIEVYKYWSQVDPSTKLVLIGEGPFKSQLMNQCELLGLSYTDWIQDDESASCVHFLPFTSNVYPYLRAANLFISCSRHEGFGRSILDALYAGTPIIAEDCPYGPRDVLSGTALLDKYLIASNSRDFEDWNSRIQIAMSKGDNALIQEGKNTALQYESSVISQQWLQMIA